MMAKFVLVLENEKITEDLEDRLYEAGFSDSALFCTQDRVQVGVEREAKDMDSAVRGVMLDLDHAGIKVIAVDLRE